MKKKMMSPLQKRWKKITNMRKVYRSVKKHKKKYRMAVNGLCELLLRKIEQ